jgi:hypothetical protein
MALVSTACLACLTLIRQRQTTSDKLRELRLSIDSGCLNPGCLSQVVWSLSKSDKPYRARLVCLSKELVTRDARMWRSHHARCQAGIRQRRGDGGRRAMWWDQAIKTCPSRTFAQSILAFLIKSRVCTKPFLHSGVYKSGLSIRLKSWVCTIPGIYDSNAGRRKPWCYSGQSCWQSSSSSGNAGARAAEGKAMQVFTGMALAGRRRCRLVNRGLAVDGFARYSGVYELARGNGARALPERAGRDSIRSWGQATDGPGATSR